MKHYRNLFLFSLIAILTLVSIPNSPVAFGAPAPTYQATVSHANGVEGGTVCTFDVNVQATTTMIVVGVTTDDSDGITVTDEDTQTYTLQTDSTSGGSGTQYSYIYTTVSPGTNAANTVTITIDSGDAMCFGITFAGTETTFTGDADSAKTTATGNTITTFTTVEDNAIIVQVCGDQNTSTFTMDESSTTRANESNGGANKFAGAISTEATTTAGADDQTCTPSKAGDMSHSVVEVKGVPVPNYVVDLLDVYESASTTLGSGTEVFVDCDLEIADACNGLSSAVFVDATSVSTQTTSPFGMEWKTDGTKMYIISQDTNDDIFEYNCTAWDASTCMDASSPLSTTAQNSVGRGIAFSPDGTKLFTTGATGNKEVNEWTCVTAWDVSTCTFDSFLDVSTEIADVDDLAFSVDGTKMFVVDLITDDITEYDCSPWDVSTCIVVDSYITSGEDTTAVSVEFSNDGLKMYVLSATADEINEYKLALPWDISSASPVDFIDITTQDSSPQGIAISLDGTKLFVLGNNDNDVNEYNLNAPLKVNVSYRVEVEVDNIGGASGSPTSFTIHDSVGSPWDISTGNFIDSFDINTQETNPNGLTFSPDGTKLFVVGDNGDDVNEYTCDPFTNSCTFVDATSVSTNSLDPFDIEFSNDGLIMIILHDDLAGGNEEVDTYTCTTSWDASTCTTYVDNFDVGTQDSVVGGFDISPDGTKMFMVGAVSDSINEYSCVAWDMSTCTFVDATSIITQSPEPDGIKFSSDGKSVYIAENSNQQIDTYTCTTSWDASTCTYADNFALITGSTRDLIISPDGTRMITVNWDDDVNEYSIGGLFGGITVTGASGCSTNTDWTDSISSESDILQTSGTTCSLVATSGTAEFWFIVTPNGDAFNDDITITITDGSVSDTSTITSLDITRPIYHFEELDVYESASTTLDSGTAICIDENFVSGRCGYKVDDAIFVDSTLLGSIDLVSDIEFNGDGTKLYAVSRGTTDEIEEYTCTTPYDASTCTTNSSPLDISSQETDPTGMSWNDDGTKLFTVGFDGDAVDEWSCTIYDVSTCTHTDATNVGAQDTAPRDVEFSKNGLKMFISGGAGNDINEYTCSSSYDASTCTTFVDTIPVNSANYAMAFDSTGYFFSVVDTGDAIDSYNCTSSFDISTCKFASSLDTSSDETAPRGITYNDNGSKLFVIGTDDEVHEYDIGLTEGSTYRVEVDIYNLGGIVDSPDVFSMLSSVGGVYDVTNGVELTSTKLTDDDLFPQSVQWNDDGMKFFLVGGSSEELNEYSCLISYNILSCSFVDSTSIATNTIESRGSTWNNDGTRFYVVDTNTGGTDEVDEYTCSVGFDASTCTTYNDTFDISGQETEPRAIVWNDDGLKFFLTGVTGDDINEYDSCTAYDVSTCSFVDSFSLGGKEGFPSGITWNTDGTKVFIVGDGSDDINQWSCTAYDVSTCSFDGAIDVSAIDSGMNGISFNDDGTKLILSGTEFDSVYEFEIANVFGSITATGSSGCSTNTDWTDSIVSSADIQQDSGTTCSLGLGGSATYWFIVTLDTDTPSIDLANFKIDDGITSYESNSMSFSVKPVAGAIDTTKNIVDNLSMIDAQTYSRLLNISDPMSITDNMAAFRAYSDSESDPISLTDSFTTQVTRFDGESDPISLTDSFTAMVTYTVPQSDPISLTDSFTTQVTRFDSKSDPLSITDSFTTTLTILDSESDPLSITDSFTTLTTRFNSESDPLSLTDSFTTIITRFDSESDPLSITDSVTTTLTIINSESDPLSITDSFTTVITRFDSESDPLSITDSFTTIITRFNSESDNLSITDSITTTRTIINSESDPLSITDSVTTTRTIINSESDALSLTDSITTLITRFNAESDPLSITDSVTTTRTIINSESDPLSITDSVTTTRTIINSESDALSLTDSVNTIRTIINSESDALSIIDSVNTITTRMNAESDPLSLTDSITTITTRLGAVSDNLSITDSITATRTIINTESDPLSMIDSVSTTRTIINSESDALSLTDSITTTRTIINTESDALSLTDSITTTRTIINTESDALSLTDSITATIMIIDTESDNLSITDNITSHITHFTSDPLSITDNVTPLCTGCGNELDTESDPLSITDSITATIVILNTESDPLSLVDSVSHITTRNLPFGEIVDADDGGAGNPDVGVDRFDSESDPLSITDSITTLITRLFNAIDSLSITDNVTPIELGNGTISINAIEAINLIDIGNASIFVYEPTGKVIWFKVSGPTNSTRGGVYESMCDTSEFVTGINGTGYIKCTLLPAPTATERGGVYLKSCGGSEYVSGVDSNGDLECTALP